eukprot:GHVN01068176.1.p1 GENE.GHVN01068176.1~~GHVN01068176.1.p1  ORF type:complete len:746 (+),score=139.94 GHVN01068176.1:1541-3778(+)
MFRVNIADLRPGDEDLIKYIQNDEELTEAQIEAMRAEVEPTLQLSETFPEWLAICGLPEVDASKLPKLEAVLKKRILNKVQKTGDELHEEQLELILPTNEKGEGTGICFVKFGSEFEADNAFKALQGESLDKNTPLGVCSLDKFDSICDFDQEYKPPEKLNLIKRATLRNWINTTGGGQQFLIRHGDFTEVREHDPINTQGPSLVFNGDQGGRALTLSRAEWSPQGSFLVTFHGRGVALRGATEEAPFDRLGRWAHEGVRAIQITKNEAYAVSWDGYVPEPPRSGVPAYVSKKPSYHVWCVLTQSLIRTCPAPLLPHSTAVLQVPKGKTDTRMPVLWTELVQWSSDGKYLAMAGDKEVNVYETPDMQLVEFQGKRCPLKYDAAKFQWSPSENILALWVPEIGDAPGRLVLVEMPSRRELSSKTVFTVVTADIMWQSEGQYLALLTKLNRKIGKKAKKEVTQIEVFSMKDKNIPVDPIHLDEGIRVKSLAWEGAGNRLGVVVQDENAKTSLRLYAVDQGTTSLGAVMQLAPFFESIHWSPMGTYFVVCSTPTEGTLVFAHVTSDSQKIEELNRQEHYMVNNVLWDPTGRFVASAVTISFQDQQQITAASDYRFIAEVGYKMWSFQGRLQFQEKKDKFYSLHWRPMPPSMLDKEKLEGIPKRLKEFSEVYDAADAALRNEQDEEMMKKKSAASADFFRLLNVARSWADGKDESIAWQRGWETLEASIEWETKEETWEEEIDIQEIVM